MKKFIIISVVLILLAAGVFGYSLYHFLDVTGVISHQPAASDRQASTDAAATELAPHPAGTDPAETTAAPASGAGIFDANLDKATQYVNNLSKEQMVGQLILGVCADPSAASSEINRYSLGGILYESSSFSYMGAEDIKSSVKAAADGSTVKPILAAREEGGSYTTFSGLDSFSNYSQSSPRSTFADGGLQAVEKAEDTKANLLKSLGINLNLAPVVDLAAQSDQIMYSRSISEDAETASAYAEYAAKFTQAKGVSVALRHFPGYGTLPDSAVSYDEPVKDDRSAETIRSTDYTPFKRGAQAGAHFIMVSNVVVQNIDSAHTAALSPAIHKELRDTVGFTGIIITDMLDEMDYSSYADGKKPVVQAVLAGNDMILVRDYATAYTDLLAAANDGTISEAQLKEAVTRVIAYKYTAGIIK